MRTTTLKLRRWWPLPLTKTVRVGAITVQGFMALVAHAAGRAAQIRLEAQRDITGLDLVRAMREVDWCLLADLICQNQEPAFFEHWITQRNVQALLDASAVANRWDRLFGTLNLDPSKPLRKGSLMDDVVAVCVEVPGQSVNEILAMPMEGFLDMLDTLNRRAYAMDPTSDPDAVASEAADLLNVPGLSVVH